MSELFSITGQLPIVVFGVTVVALVTLVWTAGHRNRRADIGAAHLGFSRRFGQRHSS